MQNEEKRKEGNDMESRVGDDERNGVSKFNTTSKSKRDALNLPSALTLTKIRKISRISIQREQRRLDESDVGKFAKQWINIIARFGVVSCRGAT